MRGAWRIILADLWWILSGPRALLLLVALPAVVLVLVGQLRARVPEYSLGVAGWPTVPSAAATQLDEGAQLWRQLSALRIVRLDGPVTDPRGVLDAQGLDLLLNVGDAGTPCWRLYSAATNPARAAAVRQVAASIERSLLLAAAAREQPSEAFCDVADEELDPGDGTEAAAPNTSVEQIATALVGFGALPPRMLTTYYPAALDRRVAMLPMTIALVLCFLPFVAAVSSLIRDKEGHTLEILLSAPDIDGRGLFLAKALFPVALTTFNFLIMVVLVDSLFGLHTKGSTGLTILAVLPGLASASLLGVVASTLVASQTQAVMASALYFVALTLLTGFVTPLAEAAPVVKVLSHFLPLSFVMPTLDAWFFGAGPRLPEGGGWLLVQVAVSAVLAAVAFRQFLRRL